MIMIGLTGSIGMGKSTTAKMFADEGVSVWDADAAVDRLYGKDSAGTVEIQKIAPDAVGDDGVDRASLKALIQHNPAILKQIEQVIHPLVAEDREQFLLKNSGANIVLLDIPLLFEKNSEDQMDVIVVVSAPANVQKERVLSRGTMDEATFEMILSRQMPDNEKRKKADYIIETTSIEHARKQVRDILNEIRNR